MRRVIAALLVLVLVPIMVVGHGDAQDRPERPPRPTVPEPAPPIVYTVDESTLPFEPVAGFEDSQREWGVLRNAGWRAEIPANWNGELVMWTHGFRGSGTDLYFNPEEVPFREYLLENGYAWAASTYSKNDYAVGTAVVDTLRLARYFGRKVADQPASRVYISGASMGGHIAAAAIERNPFFYDGAMPVCGVLGDYELFDFFLDFNVAASQIALGASEFPNTPDYAVSTAQDIKAALESVPGGWPVALNEKGEALKQLTELRSGGDRPNFDEAWFFWNSFPEFGSSIPGNFLFDLGGGDGSVGEETKVAVTNTDVYYETDLVPGPSNAIEEDLNANVARVSLDRGARINGRQSASPQLMGRLNVPVLTMHNLGDLFVPFHMETHYEQTVAARGRSHLLVQRAIRGSNHCGFTTAEYVQGFSDLVNWVENGVRPDGDAIGDPAAVAAAEFGCRFTDPTPEAHLFAAPCP